MYSAHSKSKNKNKGKNPRMDEIIPGRKRSIILIREDLPEDVNSDDENDSYTSYSSGDEAPHVSSEPVGLGLGTPLGQPPVAFEYTREKGEPRQRRMWRGTEVVHGPQRVDIETAPERLRKTDNMPDYARLEIRYPPESEHSEEMKEVCRLLDRALRLRDEYAPPFDLRNYIDAEPGPKAPFKPFECELHPRVPFICRMVDGVMRVYEQPDNDGWNARDADATPVLTEEEATECGLDDVEPMFEIQSLSDYYRDLVLLLRITSSGPVRTLAFQRLKILEARFSLHCLLNAHDELTAQKLAPHRDFYNIRKVDTHIHHSSSMNQKHLLRFIKTKLKEGSSEIVIHRDGKDLTLEEVFESLSLTAFDLNVDALDVHADKSLFHRFDKFNLKYNPIGESRLREIFLKTSNKINGRYLAEITHELFDELETTKYQMAEYRVSIYGRSRGEWDTLAGWFVSNKIYSDNVRWLIQIPRLYSMYRTKHQVTCFQDFLDNIFIPLFEVTINPASHPDLYQMLQQVVGFDCVDDESKPEIRTHKRFPEPTEWTSRRDPPFSYYMYYLWANIRQLNQLRTTLGLSTFTYRPHAGEAGDADHLASAYLLADGVNHAIMLRKFPPLQYLYYLKQIGIAMSPLSNNSLFLDYQKNPFPVFFARGLNVSLSTDDPLQFHYTKEPLIEEYSIAAQVYKLSACDQSEIAWNSVHQSSFEHPVKAHWLGPRYNQKGWRGNNINQSNLPNIRLLYRENTLEGEYEFIRVPLQDAPPLEDMKSPLLGIVPPSPQPPKVGPDGVPDPKPNAARDIFSSDVASEGESDSALGMQPRRPVKEENVDSD